MTDEQIPPASFEMLVTMLATQALVALGQVPGSEGKTMELNKPLAKHFIDLLAVLETKTNGNLEPPQSKMLADLLHNLRMQFLSLQTPGGD